MRMTLALVSICSLLVSCATLSESTDPAKGDQLQQQGSVPEAPSPDAAAIIHQDIGDGSQAQAETQAVVAQENATQAQNEQRSDSEVQSATPEVPATDTFYAGTSTPQAPTPELFPASLPEKQTVAPEEERSPVGRYSSSRKSKAEKSVKIAKSKKSKAMAKKSSKKHEKIAKKSKKSKKELAKLKAKKSKVVAKKVSKMDCKKIAKHQKKASKKEIAQCKAIKRKVASK